MSTVTTDAANEAKALLATLGQGRYSAAAVELAKDIVRLTPFSLNVAVVAAKRWMDDAGRILAEGTAKVKHGRTDANGRISLSDATKAIKGVETFALRLGAAIESANAHNKRFPNLRIEELNISGDDAKWLAELPAV